MCGLSNDTIQRKEADLTLSRAFEIAQGIEAATSWACPIGKLYDSQKRRVEKALKGPPRQSSGNGGAGRNKKIVCFRCGRPGHIARVCPQGHGNQGYSKGEMCVDVDVECAESVDAFNTVYVLRKPLSSPIVVRVKFYVKEAVMELDTGAYLICGDYKVTLNPCLDVDQHRLPKPEELYATLSGGEQFSKMDF